MNSYSIIFTTKEGQIEVLEDGANAKHACLRILEATGFRFDVKENHTMLETDLFIASFTGFNQHNEFAMVAAARGCQIEKITNK